MLPDWGALFYSYYRYRFYCRGDIHQAIAPVAGGVWRYFMAALAGIYRYYAGVGSAGNGAELPEAAIGFLSQETSKCGFTDTGRSIKNHGTKAPRLEHAAQELPFPQEMLLANELGKLGWAHASRERLHLCQINSFAFREKIGHIKLRR